MSGPRRAPGESKAMILAVLAAGAKVEKEVTAALGFTSRTSTKRLLRVLVDDGIVEHGYHLTPAGWAKLEGK